MADTSQPSAAGGRLRGLAAAPPRPAPITDGAAAIVLAAGDKAGVGGQPAWITGIDHRIETHALGARDLPSRLDQPWPARRPGVADGPVDVAELHAPYAHQELILAEALGLGDAVVDQPVGRRAGRQPASCRPASSASARRPQRIWSGEADRAVAHATSGPCLQQNLVCVLEGVVMAERCAVIGVGPDPPQGQAGRRLHRRPGPRGGRGGPGRRRPRPGPTSTPWSSARPPTCSRAS